MDIPLVILSEVYDLLAKYDEAPPKMKKKTFVEWYSQGWIYTFNVELKTLIFHCERPFSCCVLQKFGSDVIKKPDAELDELNKALADLSARHRKMLVFW